MRRTEPKTRLIWVLLLLFACTRGPSAQEPRRPGPGAQGGSQGAVLVTIAAAVHETVEEGIRVKKGGRIARIATADYVSPQQFEEVKTKREVVEVAYRLAEERLNETTLKSPLDGFVLKREISSGEYLKVGNPVATVIATNPVRYLGMVGEKDAGRVRRGEKILLSVLAGGF